jgi:ubiquinone/menaquinone biosynthesis C-methylase UbiE
MLSKNISYLRCPQTLSGLTLAEDCVLEDERVKSGTLLSETGGHAYPVCNFIPRFVSSDNYAKGFGYQWLKHARTQYDSFTGMSFSKDRFFATTRWPERLDGKVMIEAGCGSGRFTEVAAATGAVVLSFDYSAAVEANYASNGQRENVLIVQADIYQMPFARESADYLYCLGVLQHTPDVEKAFKSLPAVVKPGGRMAIDLYLQMTGVLSWILRNTSTWNVIRPMTCRMNPDRLYAFCERHIDRFWELAQRINRKPWGPFVLRRFMVPPYIGEYDLPDDLLKQWMKLDLFDCLAARYISPQTLATVQRWFEECDLDQIEVRTGHNGINGLGVKRGQV